VPRIARIPALIFDRWYAIYSLSESEVSFRYSTAKTLLEMEETFERMRVMAVVGNSHCKAVVPGFSTVLQGRPYFWMSKSPSLRYREVVILATVRGTTMTLARRPARSGIISAKQGTSARSNKTNDTDAVLVWCIQVNSIAVECLCELGLGHTPLCL
jgi:hypothetical protein